MTSIKILLDEETKKRIKRQAIEENKTITRFVLDRLSDSDTNTLKSEYERLSEKLQKNGGQMTADQREQLKQRRNELRKELGI